MNRKQVSKCKQCRRERTKLFLKGDRCHTAKCALVKRNYPPGLHGPRMARPRNVTGYGKQLREKQKAKRLYGLSESQFRRYFSEAISKKVETGHAFFERLEVRLDNVVYRLGFASSRSQARQLISHGHFLVNGKKVDIPSYKCRVSDVIKVKEKSLKSELVKLILEKIDPTNIPDWLIFDKKSNEGKVLDLPNIKKQNPGFDMNLIIEFYSR